MGSHVAQWYSVRLVIHGSWVRAALDPLGFYVGVSMGKTLRAALDPLGFYVGVSMGKTLQSPSLALVKPRKDMNRVSCRPDMTDILLKAV